MSEDAKILAALVAAFLGLLGVFYSTVVNYLRGREQDRFKAETDAKLASLKANTDKELARLNAELQTERDKRLDQLASEKVVSKFRDPLLHAAYDLQSRIFNILKIGFLKRYYTNGSERDQEYAVENTVFLLSQFLGWTELIRQEIQFLGLGTDTQTRELRRLQDGLYTQLQSDKLGSGFRLFAGEQRAVGELMIERTSDLSRCIGFATFLKHRKPDIDYWLNPLREDIKKMATGIDSYKTRLVNIQHSLIDLLHFLDPNCVRFPMERRTKI